MRELSVKATLAFFALVGGALVIAGCKTSRSTPSSQAGETLTDQRLAAIARGFASNWNHTLPKSGHRIDQRLLYHTLLAAKDMELDHFAAAVSNYDRAININSNIAVLYNLRGYCKGMCGDPPARLRTWIGRSRWTLLQVLLTG
jgi:hypothetical protein